MIAQKVHNHAYIFIWIYPCKWVYLSFISGHKAILHVDGVHQKCVTGKIVILHKTGVSGC